MAPATPAAPCRGVISARTLAAGDAAALLRLDTARRQLHACAVHRRGADLRGLRLEDGPGERRLLVLHLHGGTAVLR